MSEKYQRVFSADHNGSVVEIYRAKVDGELVFKAVQDENTKSPFIYTTGECGDKKHLKNKSGWRDAMKEALDDTPLDIWLNYVYMDVIPPYQKIVKKKVDQELDFLEMHLRYYVFNGPKYRKNPGKRSNTV